MAIARKTGSLIGRSSWYQLMPRAYPHFR
jgi:hypothetical protein